MFPIRLLNNGLFKLETICSVILKPAESYALGRSPPTIRYSRDLLAQNVLGMSPSDATK